MDVEELAARLYVEIVVRDRPPIQSLPEVASEALSRAQAFHVELARWRKEVKQQRIHEREMEAEARAMQEQRERRST